MARSPRPLLLSAMLVLTISAGAAAAGNDPAPTAAGPTPATSADQSRVQSIEIVLDASGSMKQVLPDGQTRFDAGRAAVVETLASLPPATQVALRVYGHQSKPDQKNCEDTELLAPFAPASTSRATLAERIAGLSALGYTPISLSLQQAAADFAAAPAGRRTIILISDGKETCKSDPCAVAKALAAADAELVVYTVGFGVDAAARQQLRCVAEVARGSYYDANSAGQLTERLRQAVEAPAPVVRPEPPKAEPATGFVKVEGIAETLFIVNSESGDAPATVEPGKDSAELPVGIWQVKLANGIWTGIKVESGKTTVIRPAYARFESPVDTVLYLWDLETDESVFSLYPSVSQVTALLPGRYRVMTKEMVPLTEIEFIAGQTTVLGPAVITINGGLPSHQYRARTPGSDDIGHGPYYTDEPFVLPPGLWEIGDFLAEGSKRVPIEVQEGGRYSVDLTGG